jgi:hypothetical protein
MKIYIHVKLLYLHTFYELCVKVHTQVQTTLQYAKLPTQVHHRPLYHLERFMIML